MQTLLPNKREHPLCLRPKDKDERKEFWKYRCDLAIDPILYITILNSTFILLDVVISFPTEWSHVL